MKHKLVAALTILSWFGFQSRFTGIAAGQPLSAVSQTATIDFTRDIRPIFADRCYSCHGPEKQKSGFRLDLKEPALAGGDSGKVILPGKSRDSLLYRYIAGLHPEIRMPPKGEPLPPCRNPLPLREKGVGLPRPRPFRRAVGARPCDTRKCFCLVASQRYKLVTG